MVGRAIAAAGAGVVVSGEVVTGWSVSKEDDDGEIVNCISSCWVGCGVLLGFELLETAGQAVLLKQDSPFHFENQVYCRIWRRRGCEESIPCGHAFVPVDDYSHLGSSLLSNLDIDFYTWTRHHPGVMSIMRKNTFMKSEPKIRRNENRKDLTYPRKTAVKELADVI